MPRHAKQLPAFCVLLKANGLVESNWHQAIYATPGGASGFPLINSFGRYNNWSPLPLTLPDRRHFPTDPATPPGPIPEPSPTHTSACPAASITRSPAELIFLADPGSTTPQSATLSLREPYGAGFAWRAGVTATWVSLSPTAGSSLPDDVRVTVNPAGLPAGTHRATITVTSTDGAFAPVTAGVTLVIAPVQRLYLPFAARSSP